MELICFKKKSLLNSGDKALIVKEEPFQVIESVLEKLRLRCCLKSHFAAGCIGYFSYDLKDAVENISETSSDDLTPLAHLIFPRVILEYDWEDQGKWRIFTLFSDLSEKEAMKLSRDIKNRMFTLRKSVPGNLPTAGKIESSLSREEYVRNVKTAIDHIRRGDIYQACLSQRFSCDYPAESFPLFQKMEKTNPAPFASFLRFKKFSVLSSSPELFIKCTEKDVETRPMKGTRRRGSTPKEDSRLKKELEQSVKDSSELSMIVDLERNDMGKFCEAGSVKVSQHRKIESYPTVHQTISVIQGKRKADSTLAGIIKSMFPGGSITGCPKIRAMEIIDKLEPVKRNIYTGSIGYISFHDTMQLNIAIRTMVHAGRKLYFHAGGGVVADSDPEKEYLETLDKAKAIFTVLNSKI